MLDFVKWQLGDSLSAADRILLTPKDFVGGCAVITTAEGSTVLGWDPYKADVTEACRRGETIRVTIVGTRRNLFGPLHQAVKVAPVCGPGNFLSSGKMYCESYSLNDSGLKGIIFKLQRQA